MTSKGSLTPLSHRSLPRFAAGTLGLSTFVLTVAFGTFVLNSCGGDTFSSSSRAASAAASASSSSQSYSTSSAPGGWADLTAGFPGHLVATAAVVPGQDKVIALTGMTAPIQYYTSVAYSTVDGGSTWQQLGQGAGSAPLTVAPIGIIFDPKDSTGDTFWLYGVFAGGTGGVFSTTDGGQTFTAHAVGKFPYEVDGMSIDSATSTILLGQHEAVQSVYKSTDGGMTWTNIGATLPPGQADSEYPYIVDSQTYLVGCSFAIDGTYDTGNRAVGGTPGIFRTADGGKTWTQVVSKYKVFGPPTLLNGVLYWSYYNGADGGILSSSDYGQTWTDLVQSGLTWSVTPVALPNGQLASVSSGNQILLYTPGAANPTALLPNFPLTSPLDNDLVLGLAFDSVRNSYFGWVTSGGIVRLDMN
jgi:photosystem II stability/assembly factor-like uncharacterized protein